MSIARNNHFVPEWYQRGILEPGRKTLAYLDLLPAEKTLKDGRIITVNSKFKSPVSRSFKQRDLYSTFFGTSVNDEIERHLFGDIDTRGAKAIRAFIGENKSEWHHHFQTLFEYIDIQKIRTPKGLDWLKSQYPSLSQNELMFEMQGIRMMHCTIWSECVREIVSAEGANTKFLISDHPVTVYNHAATPQSAICDHPYDPAISLKGSQTLFPLNRNFCLILSNLEYARDPFVNPLSKRTFARNYRESMARTDAFIRSRKLSNHEVAKINYIIKMRAQRFIAAGQEEWLYPEETVTQSWSELRTTLLPPEEGLFHFGGEMFVKFESGHIQYQDEFGRTEKERDFLNKNTPEKPLGSKDLCGCGSGKEFRYCCQSKPVDLRPSWSEMSIRERNLKFFEGVINIIGFDNDWVQVRREMTDEKIENIYRLYDALWPRETDILAMLPKPDKTMRAVYTGHLHPMAITKFALNLPHFFGEVLIEHPFLHPGAVNKKFSPVENPSKYRQEVLKSILLFITLMPLVESGKVILVPDPCNFDIHLRDQMIAMAKSRVGGIKINSEEDETFKIITQEDFKRSLSSLPDEALRHQISKSSPHLDKKGVENILKYIHRQREQDPLAMLQSQTQVPGEKREQYRMVKLSPNFEMTLYIAQATGSFIITDSVLRWEEISRSIRMKLPIPAPNLKLLSSIISASTFDFPIDFRSVQSLKNDSPFLSYESVIGGMFNYLQRLDEHGRKPNFEAHLTNRFKQTHQRVQKVLKEQKLPCEPAQMSCVFPKGGIRDNAVNRLLLMSNSEHHLRSIPMAFFIKPKK